MNILNEFSKEPSSPQLKDFIVIFYIYPFWILYQYIGHKFFYKYGRKIMVYQKGEEFINKKEKKVVYVSEKSFNYLNHALLSVFCWFVFRNREWWMPNEENVWRNIKSAKFDYPTKVFIMINIIFHTHTFIYQVLMVIFKKRVLKLEMLIHHIITFMLFFFMYLYNYVAVGSIVMFTHDFSDIFVGLTKISKAMYLKRTAEVTFFIHLFTWFYFRIYSFPKTIVIPSIRRYYSENFCFFARKILVPCLVILYVLEVFWFVIFIRILFLHYYKKEEEVDFEFREKKK